MGRFNKKYILIIMLSGIFLLTGCKNVRIGTYNASKGNNSLKVTVVPDNGQSSSEDTDKITPTTAADKKDKSTDKEAANDKELSVYTVNTEDGSGDILPVTAMIPADSKKTPDLIVEKVVESLADQSIKVVVKDVTTQKDAVIVNFDKDAAPYKNMGSEFEANILNVIAQSLIDNLEDYNKVIFRVDGKAYKSDHLEYRINQPYMEK